MKKENKPMTSSSRRLPRKAKLIIASVCILFVIFLFIRLIIVVGNWFDNNRIVGQQMVNIKIQTPFRVEKRKEDKIVSPIPEKKKTSFIPVAEAKELPALAEPAGLNEIVQDVWMLESTQGKATQGHHIACRAKGEWNELGYNNLNGYCFPDKETGFARVERWFTEQLQTLTLSQALCKYNTGTPSDNCDYYQNYLSLQ